MESSEYRTADIRKRMIEFLGGGSLEEATCVCLSNSRGAKDLNCLIKPTKYFDYFVESEKDFSRSLHDRQSLLIDLDIEYVNFDFPAEPYLDRVRAIGLQQPVRRLILETLEAYGIRPLCLLTGRGYHFIWRVNKTSRAFRRLSDLGRISDELKKRYGTGSSPSVETGQAFAGAGMIMEHLMHEIKQREAGQSSIPLEILEVSVTPQQRGKEIISLDISEYADPLDTRFVRVPFSNYLKPFWKPGVLTPETQGRIAMIAVIPATSEEFIDLIGKSQDPEAVQLLAQESSTAIPEMPDGTEALTDSYEHSVLRRFHDYFYRQEQELARDWPATYDLAATDALPPCVRFILEHPNDPLLSPGGLRLVTAALLAADWHPRHIAGLIRSKYERDHGWLNEWYVYDAGTRADFYVRVFAGLIHTGEDPLEDLNCQTLKRAGLCPLPHEHCAIQEMAEVLSRKELFV